MELKARIWLAIPQFYGAARKGREEGDAAAVGGARVGAVQGYSESLQATGTSRPSRGCVKNVDAAQPSW
jgi:hypothetical protein